ncbi:hypothetical protein GCM10027436_40130 [Actinophytocola sediminis]
MGTTNSAGGCAVVNSLLKRRALPGIAGGAMSRQFLPFRLRGVRLRTSSSAGTELIVDTGRGIPVVGIRVADPVQFVTGL